MKSWDLQVCDRTSTITHVDRDNKIIHATLINESAEM